LQLKGNYPPFQSTAPQSHWWRGEITTFGVVCNVQYRRACRIILRMQDLKVIYSITQVKPRKSEHTSTVQSKID
jgi:hypothetical protein